MAGQESHAHSSDQTSDHRRFNKGNGIYLFDFREDAQKYITMHTERMAGVGVTELDVILSDVNEDLSTLTKATLS